MRGMEFPNRCKLPGKWLSRRALCKLKEALAPPVLGKDACRYFPKLKLSLNGPCKPRLDGNLSLQTATPPAPQARILIGFDRDSAQPRLQVCRCQQGS